MEYGTPVKLPDGRYFLKMANSLHQVNGTKLVDSLTGNTISFSISESSQEVIRKCDEEVLAKAKECKQQWFGKDLSDETIQAAYQDSLTDDVLSVAPAKLKGEVILTAFDTKKTPIELQDVKEGAVCDVLFELAGLWFLKKSFGPIWRAVQVRVRGAAKSPIFSKEYLFNDSPEDEPETDPADYID
jgi:Family of unknown function (DUF5871)